MLSVPPVITVLGTFVTLLLYFVTEILPFTTALSLIVVTLSSKLLLHVDVRIKPFTVPPVMSAFAQFCTADSFSDTIVPPVISNTP